MKRARSSSPPEEDNSPKQRRRLAPGTRPGRSEQTSPYQENSTLHDHDDPKRVSKHPPANAEQKVKSIEGFARSAEPSTKSLKRARSPSPSQEASRPRKKPGASSRINRAAKEAVLQRQKVREEQATAIASTRGVSDAVRHHYNAVPQRGREWRRTDSRIKGLRGFNNWVKSTIIHKFAPNDSTSDRTNRLLVLDLGCGKGGDLAKWAQAPQEVGLYVGVDPAEVSIEQARERYTEMDRRAFGGRGGRNGHRGSRHPFHAEFVVQDAFGQSIGNIPIVREVGFDAKGGSRWSGGGFDVVSMMFCMHYAFEDEGKARGMLQNIAGALKKGGKFIGTMPNSDVLRAKVEQFHKQRTVNPPRPPEEGASKPAARPATAVDGDVLSEPQTSATEPDTAKPQDPTPGMENGETDSGAVASWGNSIYQVRFPGQTPPDGIFRPPFGWKYNYFLDEAVEVPEYVVPWEAFRALAEDFNLELQYRKPFTDIWKEESNEPSLRALSERMGVVDRYSGELLVTHEEMEAVGFYHAFCFYKV
ncbi:MAG: hypothetical protein Q9219_003290 [cf. Caloplaca sp. 3 TL-2023]